MKKLTSVILSAILITSALLVSCKKTYNLSETSQSISENVTFSETTAPQISETSSEESFSIVESETVETDSATENLTETEPVTEEPIEAGIDLNDEANIPFRLAGMTFAEIEAEFGTMKYEYLIAGGIPVYSLDSCPDILIRFTKVTGISDDGMPRATGNDLPNRIELNSGKVYPGVAVGMNAEEVQALVPDLDPQSGTFSLSEIAGAYPTCYSRDGFNIIVRWKFPDETFYELENNMWDGNTAQDYWETHEFNGTVLAFDVIKIKA